MAVAVAATLFGTSGVARGLGPDGLTSVFVGSWRVVIGGATLVVAAVARRQAPWDGPARPAWTLLGGLAVIGYQLAFFAATERVGVGAAAVVTIGTGPIVAGVLDRVVFGRRPGTQWIIGVAVAIVGVAVLSAADAGGGPATGWGFAIAAGCCYPVYGLAAQRLMADRTPLAAIATVFGAGAVLIAPVAIGASGSVDLTVEVVTMIAYIGVLATGLAYGLWALGLHRLSLSDTVAVTLAEPAAAVVLSTVLLDEPLRATSVAGMVTVLVGVAVATLQSATSDAISIAD